MLQENAAGAAHLPGLSLACSAAQHGLMDTCMRLTAASAILLTSSVEKTVVDELLLMIS